MLKNILPTILSSAILIAAIILLPNIYLFSKIVSNSFWTQHFFLPFGPAWFITAFALIPVAWCNSVFKKAFYGVLSSILVSILFAVPISVFFFESTLTIQSLLGHFIWVILGTIPSAIAIIFLRWCIFRFKHFAILSIIVLVPFFIYQLLYSSNAQSLSFTELEKSMDIKTHPKKTSLITHHQIAERMSIATTRKVFNEPLHPNGVKPESEMRSSDYIHVANIVADIKKTVCRFDSEHTSIEYVINTSEMYSFLIAFKDVAPKESFSNILNSVWNTVDCENEENWIGKTTELYKIYY